MEILAHNVDFYHFKPASFTCLSVSKFGLVAAARLNGTVEIYADVKNFYLISRLANSLCKSVESLLWVSNRLMVCTSSGILAEFNVNTCSLKAILTLSGCSVPRCMVYTSKRLLIGNDEGVITLCSVTGELKMEKTLVQLNGKIMCLSVNDCDKKIVAAGTSEGVVYILNWKKDIVMNSFSISAGPESSDVVVWSLLFVGGVLFSGDSTGTVAIWDTKIGGMLYSFPSHTADVLALTKSPDNLTVFAAGIDPIIRCFCFTTNENGEAIWQTNGLLRGCTRDVRAIAYLSASTDFNDVEADSENIAVFDPTRVEDDRLLAVGGDARLQLITCDQLGRGLDALASAEKTLAWEVGRPSLNDAALCEKDSNYSRIKALEAAKQSGYVAALPFWPTGAAPLYRPNPICLPHIYVTSSDNEIMHTLCLMHYDDRLALVKLASSAVSADASAIADTTEEGFVIHIASITRRPAQLAEIRPKPGESMLASAISPSGLLIAYSDSMRTRVLQVHAPDSWDKCDAEVNKLVTNHKPVRISRFVWPTSTNSYCTKRSRRARSTSQSSVNSVTSQSSSVNQSSTEESNIFKNDTLVTDYLEDTNKDSELAELELLRRCKLPVDGLQQKELSVKLLKRQRSGSESRHSSNSDSDCKDNEKFSKSFCEKNRTSLNDSFTSATAAHGVGRKRRHQLEKESLTAEKEEQIAREQLRKLHEAQLLPPARCLAFSADGSRLLLVNSEQANQIICIDVGTRQQLWQFTAIMDNNSSEIPTIHAIAVSHELNDTDYGIVRDADSERSVKPRSAVVALALENGHVMILRLSDGFQIFVCPKATFATSSDYASRVVAMDFLCHNATADQSTHPKDDSELRGKKGKEKKRKTSTSDSSLTDSQNDEHQLSILYASGVFTEWYLPKCLLDTEESTIDKSINKFEPVLNVIKGNQKSPRRTRHSLSNTPSPLVKGSPLAKKMEIEASPGPTESDDELVNELKHPAPRPNTWLLSLGSILEKHMPCLGAMHSLAYLSKDAWLLASDRVLLIIRRNVELDEKAIKSVVKKGKNKVNSCIRVIKDYSNIMQAAILRQNQLILVKEDTSKIRDSLIRPIHKKRFGL